MPTDASSQKSRAVPTVLLVDSRALTRSPCCPSYQATMQGTKRRELAELRENIKVAVEDVARTSVGASPQEVCIIVTSQCARSTPLPRGRFV